MENEALGVSIQYVRLDVHTSTLKGSFRRRIRFRQGLV